MFRVSVLPETKLQRNIAKHLMLISDKTNGKIFTHTMGNTKKFGPIACYTNNKADAYTLKYEIETTIPNRVTIEETNY